MRKPRTDLATFGGASLVREILVRFVELDALVYGRRSEHAQRRHGGAASRRARRQRRDVRWRRRVGLGLGEDATAAETGRGVVGALAAWRRKEGGVLVIKSNTSVCVCVCVCVCV